MPNKPTVYTFRTKTGRPIRVRPLVPEDAPYLVDLFENMSQDSRYQRYLQTLEHIDMERVWSTAEQIAEGMAINSHGLLAFCDMVERPDVPVAAARYVYTDAGEAEIGISVRDDMQGLGIGAQLMGLLLDEARRAGVERLVALFHSDNVAIRTIFNKLDCRLTRKPDGMYTYITLYIGEPLDVMDAAADFSPEARFIG
ncbi:MAG: GNAT family N-acetyltransferase [Candidatus Promineofilum sp.]|nr:GNAT family N-acetyltransferase [Promineifilum sp.]